MRNEAMGEPRKRLTRMRYDQGPMGFLSDQIMKQLQMAGYPPREFNLYRSPEKQMAAYNRRASRAKPYQSAHQYYGASDIIHERWAWFAAKEAPDGDPFWNALWDCVQVVAEKFDVKFDQRLTWDAAHVELVGWEEFREVVGQNEPNATQLQWWFERTLPRVWKQHQSAQKAKA